MTRRLVSYVAVAYLLAVTLPFTAQAATTTAKSTEHHSAAHHSAKPASTPKIDLNSAPESELATLPGIDAATAAKIVSMRPFKSRDQLVSKGIVTKEQFATIEHHVTAKQVKSEAKTAEKSATKEAPKAAGSTEGTTTK